jgi:Ca2+-transporting ATPase
MEKSIKEFGNRTLQNTEHLHDDWMLIQEYPLSEDLLAMSHVWRSPDGKDYIIASKGAPEAVADLCHFNEHQMEELEKYIGQMAGEGLRIIGVAKAGFRESDLPLKQHDFNFQFLGLLGFRDPVRPLVNEAVQKCYDAGVRVLMITGDYSGTAQHIGREIGLKNTDKVFTGLELDQVEDSSLRNMIKNVNIFARVVPEEKLRLVEALKANDEIVAMTGDGVNDAPALKSAQVGISMGARGTDVAREASDLVLLNDDFSSIVSAIEMGRRIFDNLKKAAAYIFSVHVPIVGLSLLPVIFGWPLILFPVQIVFLELIIDPACSIVFEAEPAEKNVMKRPPRSSSEALFDRRTISISILQGVVVLFFVLLVFLLAFYGGKGENISRTLCFTTLIFANLALILTNRSWNNTILESLRTPNRALWWIMAIAILFLILALYLPFMQNLFKFGPITLIDLILCLLAGGASVIWFEGLKYFKKF